MGLKGPSIDHYLGPHMEVGGLTARSGREQLLMNGGLGFSREPSARDSEAGDVAHLRKQREGVKSGLRASCALGACVW